MDVPERIGGFTVLEFGYFRTPLQPTSYVPSPAGHAPLEPVQNVAICTADGVDGFYTLFCSPEWRYVTYSFNETMGYAKGVALAEFGQDVVEWRRVR